MALQSCACKPVLRYRAAVCRVTGVPRRVHVARATTNSPSSVVEDSKAGMRFKHLLLTILDANEFLSDGSKQALGAAAQMARADAGRVTVLVIDEPGTSAKEPQKQVDTISWHLREGGVDTFEVVQRKTTQPASVLIGDVADEVNADLCLVSSEAVHSKYVDANQLVEFVSCPLLVLP